MTLVQRHRMVLHVGTERHKESWSMKLQNMRPVEKGQNDQTMAAGLAGTWHKDLVAVEVAGMDIHPL